MDTDGEHRSQGIFSQDLLSTCISCGFCLPACPTYELTQREQSSPRGRISLMRSLEMGEIGADDPVIQEETSFCLGCRACESACPAGVEYGHLLEELRDHQWVGSKVPVRVRPLLALARRRWPWKLAGFLRRAARAESSDAAPGMPGLMLGCFERALFPAVSRAMRQLSPEVKAPAGQGCCGALHAHNGRLEEGRQMARDLGDLFAGPILTTSGGCATHLADVLGRERVVEASEWLSPQATPSHPTRRARLRVAVQDSCHLRHGLKVADPVRDLVRALDELVELETAGSCCGAAGSYSILRRRDSRRVAQPKLDEIAQLDVDILVTLNPGCLRQMRQSVRRARLDVRVMHVAEYVASRAEGGTTR